MGIKRRPCSERRRRPQRRDCNRPPISVRVRVRVRGPVGEIVIGLEEERH